MSNQEQEHYDAGAQTPVTDSGSILEKPKEEDMFQMPQMPERTWKDHAMITIFCLFIAFGGFVFGFDTGTISGFVNMSDFLRRFGQHNSSGYYFSNVREGLVVSIFNIGCAFGSIFLTKLADMYGRRFGLMFSMAVYVVGIIIQIASINKWYQLFIGRIISGLGVGIISVLCPLFIGETAPKQLRGTLVYCFQLFITLGIFLGYCTTYGTKVYTDSRQWRIPLGLCFAWAIIMVVGMLSMPESPRFLVEKGKIEEAKKSVGRSNNLPAEDPGVYSEVMTIQAGIIHENSEGKATWAELVTGKPKIFQRVLMGMILQSLQQLTGDNYFFYYGTTIFKAVGLQDSFETSIVLGVVNFASTFVGIWAIEQFGRRKSLMVGAIAIFLCFIVYSILGSVALFIGPGYDPNNTHVPTGDGMIFVTCVCIFFFASTWAGGAYTIIAESYPIRIRSKAMAVASASNWVWGFLISFFTPFITSAIHFYYGFVFAGCMVFGTVYVYFCVMETKGLTLEEVDQLYASGLPPWKSSHWVPPRKEDTIAAAATAGEAKPEEERV